MLVIALMMAVLIAYWLASAEPQGPFSPLLAVIWLASAGANMFGLLSIIPILLWIYTAHANLRGTAEPRWAEINAVHERSGVYGLLEWLGLPANLDPAALADGEMDNPLVLAQHRAGGRVDNLARDLGLGPDLAHDPGIVAIAPIGEIMPALLARTRMVRHLVARQPRGARHRLRCVEQVGGGLQQILAAAERLGGAEFHCLDSLG